MVQLDVVLAVKLEVEGVGASLTRSTLTARRASYVVTSCYGEEQSSAGAVVSRSRPWQSTEFQLGGLAPDEDKARRASGGTETVR